MRGDFARCEECLEKERVAARKRRLLYAWKAQQLEKKREARKAARAARRVCLCHGLVNPEGDDHRY